MSWLALRLLLTVLLETLLADLGSLLVLFLVVAAEQVDIVVVLLSRGGLGGVQGGSNNLGAVDGVRLRSVTGEGSEVIVEASNVLVPTRGIGVLGSSRRLLQCLEDGNIRLGGRIAIEEGESVRKVQKCTNMLVESSSVGLEAARKHGPIDFITRKGVKTSGNTNESSKQTVKIHTR